MLCRASTGGGISKRKLYTDDEEMVLSFRRCVVLNGIQPGVTRPDLLDRTIPLHLERMKPGQRKEERTFWAAFEAARPRLVGAMFEVLAKAMHRYPTSICRPCRAWPISAAGDTPWPTPWAWEAPHFSRPTRTRSVPRTRRPSRTTLSPLPSSRSSVAGTLLPQGRGARIWSGTAADLLTALEATAAEQRIDVKAKSWPKAAHILMRRLNEVKSNLLDIGVQVPSQSDGTTRQVTFRKVYRN